MSDVSRPDRESLAEDQRARRARELLDEFLVRRANGESISIEELRECHGELRSEIAAELQKLELIDQARLQAAAAGSGEFDGESTEHPTLLLVRCPRCQARVEIDCETSLSDVQCTACGQDFRMVRPWDGDVPTRVGRFELLERLGAGSFGAVWRARDTKLDREVAIKIPRRQSLAPLEVEEVIREARIAAQLRHRHIVAIHEVGLEGETVYIVSDLIRGLPLDEWMQRHPMNYKTSAKLCRVIAEALEHAHRAGVIHRDLKPSNIMIDDVAEPHLTDFGLAKRAGEQVAITMDGHILGTPAYMSPEQARGEASCCDGRSDVYSMGVVLFQLLTNELPFRGNMSVLPHKVIHDEPPSPRRLNRYVPRDLETICLKCLEKDPRKRYQTAGKLADDIGRFTNNEPIHARPVGPVGRLWRWSRRRPAVAALACATIGLLVLIAALTTWGYLRERNYRQQQDRLWAFIRHSDTVQDYRRRVEDAARSPDFAKALTSAVNHRGLTAMREKLNDPKFDGDWQVQRQKFVDHPGRAELQAWVNARFDESDRDNVFAWFVHDAQGLQLARAPIGGENIGQNYAWRTYFHGGDKDFGDSKDYLKNATGKRIASTKLSQPFFTESTREWVIAISTPVTNSDQFLGIVGVFLYVTPPNAAETTTPR